MTLYAGWKEKGTTGAAKWSYQTNTLTISGSGAMADYGSGTTPTPRPWGDFTGNINNISIGSGVTQIGNYAFFGFGAVNSVTISSGVNTIGEYAFAESSLKTVTIPNTVTSICTSAFGSCDFAKTDNGATTDNGSFTFEGTKAQWNAATNGHNLSTNPFTGSNPAPTKVICSDGDIPLNTDGTVRTTRALEPTSTPESTPEPTPTSDSTQTSESTSEPTPDSE